MPLISSPGVAFIVVDDPPGTSAQAVFNSVLSGWPVLVLTLLMALLSGIIMWGLVRESLRHRHSQRPALTNKVCLCLCLCLCVYVCVNNHVGIGKREF